ncbi:hypothetical protein KAT72_07810 [Aeromonas popoffii]|uniref:Uncharacterized protein n=1 Tax=Aeromonas popoffii TaxID=70856 RepID=A0ABS5GP79_9GAMM|nr:hypothetical protein [Aeromonas popoffii]MBR7628941.1 hypothetical protein [Aeromonas popoffii]
MPYTFSMANDVTNIEERQYGVSKEIRFSTFTSCIGLVAENGGNVTGVHLSILSDTDELFNDNAAEEAIKLLGQYSKVVVMGLIDYWTTKELIGPYTHLLNNLTSPIVMPVGDGVYGGKVEINGDFKIYENGIYVDVP